MPLTLLLDLDDTLLDTNMGEFIPAYFQALAKHLTPWVRPETMLPALMSGTQAMLANEDPSLTLQQVFDRHFYPRLGVEKEQLSEAVEDFYDHVFHELGEVTRQRPGARELVDWALARGDRLVIATDPLFPGKAVNERIRWAGLDPGRFELISSYESFHFSKSRAAYYAELLGRLGWPDGPVLMVGNDEERDLARAHELGLVTYQVDGAAQPGVAGETRAQPSQAIAHGSLTELRYWLGAVDLARIEPGLHRRRGTEAILAATPAVLASLTASLDATAWKQEPGPDEWALIEIVCHLRDTEREVHRIQMEKLRDEVQPFIPRPDAAVWAKQRNYLNDDGAQALTAFTRARQDTLAEIAALAPEVWKRSARHAIFGPTSAEEVLGFMADHDRLHVQQAWQTLNRLR
ncbi:MAG TPA: DinB family protein [Anaerolineales bacterium]